MFAIRETIEVVHRTFNQIQCGAGLTRSIFSHKNAHPTNSATYICLNSGMTSMKLQSSAVINAVPCSMILYTSLQWLRQEYKSYFLSTKYTPSNPRANAASKSDSAATFPAQSTILEHTTIRICIRSTCSNFLATQTMVWFKIKDKIV